MQVKRKESQNQPAVGGAVGVSRADDGLEVLEKNGAPGVIRTPGLLVRSQTLYPAELRARKGTAFL